MEQDAVGMVDGVVLDFGGVCRRERAVAGVSLGRSMVTNGMFNG